MKKIIFAVFTAVLLSCGGNSGRSYEENNFIVDGNNIIINEESPILSNISTQTIHESDYQATFTTSGIVQTIPNKYAEIASPFAGRIIKSFVHLGQKVFPGSPIFEISSSSFFEAGKEYFQTKQEMELALKNLTREKDLFKNNVGVAKDVEEAEVNYELKKKDFENALATLQIFNVDPEKMILGQPLIVRSPIAGEIVKNNIVLGQYLKEDAESLAAVADLDKVWVVAHVKEKDIYLIQHLANVEIRLTAMPDTPIKGSVFHISDLLEEDTHSVEVFIECDNKDHKMKPFMYGTVELTDTPAKAILIPNSAVLQNGENNYVLVKTGHNKYRKTIIITASSNETQTAVVSGLNDGEKIITEGAFYFIETR